MDQEEGSRVGQRVVLVVVKDKKKEKKVGGREGGGGIGFDVSIDTLTRNR